MNRLGRAAACALALAAAAGCTQDDESPESTPQPAAGAGQSGSMSGAATSNSAGAGTTAMTAAGSSGAAQPSRDWPSCGEAFDDQDGGVSPYADACAIDERFGVFVDPTRGNDASGDGSRDRPFASLKAAIAQAVHQSKRVYACAGVYAESVRIGTELSDGLQLLGGLSCETFLVDPSGAHSIVRAPGPGAALLIADTRSVLIERFDFESVADQSAPGATYVGGLIQNASGVVLRDVGLLAADGEPGKDGAAADPAAQDGIDGEDGAAACAANPNPGGAGSSNRDCPNLAGGSGGDGGVGTGNGGFGNWYGSPNFRGEDGTDWSCAPGVGMGYQQPTMPYPGQPGRGAGGFGALVGNGFIGFAGQDGFVGSAGQPGAGGGGARAPSSCSGLGTATGASGGGGGGAGCGGEGGKAGGAGGSSIGLIAVDARVRFERGSIRYGNGGRGGNGAEGQAGGKGGSGGQGGDGTGGSKNACDGTTGSDGGSGGPGGGGNGGHALGVLYIGRAPQLIGVEGEADAASHSGGEPGTGPESVEEPMAQMLMTGTPGETAFQYEF